MMTDMPAARPSPTLFRFMAESQKHHPQHRTDRPYERAYDQQDPLESVHVEHAASI
jgi:hypothetical protein